ncbi:predicted protein [Uncinocarpus reesii 1704]|uniref:Uncharacterized protein n=1 Tax=Uncinocarpus reesii (strain UAMH 1704) TaxID=336963 RepID=C4JUY2_UNCRE|nr:uncharacterized protein UREG_04935 [Uncinocarpus reesii 1704]EEP80093.1 predicted protein [Uncinocarpus reesii 1704]
MHHVIKQNQLKIPDRPTRDSVKQAHPQRPRTCSTTSHPFQDQVAFTNRAARNSFPLADGIVANCILRGMLEFCRWHASHPSQRSSHHTRTRARWLAGVFWFAPRDGEDRHEQFCQEIMPDAIGADCASPGLATWFPKTPVALLNSTSKRVSASRKPSMKDGIVLGSARSVGKKMMPPASISIRVVRCRDVLNGCSFRLGSGTSRQVDGGAGLIEHFGKVGSKGRRCSLWQ